MWAFARNYVNQRLGDCNLVHSTNRPYGENLAKGSGEFTGRAAVELWVREKPFYDYASNSCVGGEWALHAGGVA
ncbi:UNVERIFIED_CONTAM: Pathogenesis-related leaf protein 6 [Sesamum latifolium]|uniref:Pathogenesis-related leaf protein 6 n=1 Tax=Sesamum latifolium TaxID=2727402 RepID=A0AAW2XK20_9LAMI